MPDSDYVNYRETARRHFVAGYITKDEYKAALKGLISIGKTKIFSGPQGKVITLLYPNRAKKRDEDRLLGIPQPILKY